jgi:hypothetical protein
MPSYPGPLPGGVEANLQVPLKRFSLEFVNKVFMMIEEPEHPLNFPVTGLGAKPVTIGQFYDAIKLKIIEGGADLFKLGDPKRQLTAGFPSMELMKVTDVDSAVRAIEMIVQQGEGTTISPLDPEHQLAHYYRFAEIWHGRELVPILDAPDDKRFSYSGPEIPFDPQGILPVIDNPRASNYPPGSAAQQANRNFNYTYTSLLKTLHLTFNGHPEKFAPALGLMESVKEFGDGHDGHHSLRRRQCWAEL